MLEKIEKWVSKYRDFFVIAFPAAIVLIYLWCCCFGTYDMDDIKEILWELLLYNRPTVVNSLIIILVYWAWRSYREENVPTIITILLAGIAVILPFIESVYRLEDRMDFREKLFGFALMLWPVLVTYISDFCIGRFIKKDKTVIGVNIAVVFILAAGFHLFAEGLMEERWSNDLIVPVIWMAESLLWTVALHFTDGGKNRKRNVVMAWLICLIIFYCFTFIDTSYLSSTHIWGMVRGRYWGMVLYLCWPVFLTVMIRSLCSRIPKDDSHFVQKVSIPYFCIVLLLSYLLTDISLNFAIAAFRDDICKLAYLLFLAEAVVWKEIYGNQKHKVNRVRVLLFLMLVNIGVFAFLLVRNERLREVLYYMGFSFMGNGLSIPQADWTGYRKATFDAFFTNDLTVLNNAYKNEGYYSVLHYSHGLAAIRFHVGIFPVLAMILLLVLAISALCNWNRNSEAFHKCAGYLAVGYLFKMLMSVVLQINMILSPNIEFPFTGLDIPELVVLILLVYEGRRKSRETGGDTAEAATG